MSRNTVELTSTVPGPKNCPRLLWGPHEVILLETVLQSLMLRKSNPAMWFRCVSLSNCSEIMTNDRGALEGQGLSDHTNSWTPKFTLQIRWVWIVYFRMACEILLFLQPVPVGFCSFRSLLAQGGMNWLVNLFSTLCYSMKLLLTNNILWWTF